MLWLTEDPEPDVGEDERFSEVAQGLESHSGDTLALWREIVPGVLSLHDGADDDRDDAGHFDQVRYIVSQECH